MATSTFERRIELTNPDDIKKLVAVMTSDPPKDPISTHPYGEIEREKSAALLKQWSSLLRP